MEWMKRLRTHATAGMIALPGAGNAAAPQDKAPAPRMVSAASADELQTLIKELKRALRENDSDNSKVAAATLETLQALKSRQPEERAKASTAFEGIANALFKKLAQAGERVVNGKDKEQARKDHEAVMQEFRATIHMLDMQAGGVTAHEREAAGKLLNAVLTHLAGKLGSADFWEREASSRILEHVGAPARNAVYAAMFDPSAEIQQRAYLLYPRVERADQERAGFARRAVAELTKLGPQAADAASTLSQALRVRDTEFKLSVARALAAIGPAAKDATLELIDALKDQEMPVREQAARALMHIGPDAKAAVPALTQALKDKHFYVRRMAADALGAMGGHAASAIAALEGCLQDENSTVRANAVGALGAIAPLSAGTATTLIASFAKEDHVGIQCDILRVLAHGGAQATATAMPLFAATLEHKNPKLRQAAALALGHLGKHADAALPALRKLAAAPEAKDTSYEGKEAQRAVMEAIRAIEGKGR